MPNTYTSAFGSGGGSGLPLTGGTLTGAINFSSSAPQTILTTVNNFSKINTGIYGSFVLADNVGDYIHLGLGNTGIQMRSGYFLGWSSSATAAGTAADLLLYRSAAASLQLGANNATTATNQTVKAHDVSTGTGADLILKGGTGSGGNNGNVRFGTYTATISTITGYITIKDEGGTVRKLAVVA